ncbi:MAG: O-antigen ligase family protein [Methylococcaceae bacterium]
MEPAGYPDIFLYLMLIIGLPLAFLKPYKAFLVVVFILSAADATAFTFTRIPALGPYFNANDACLLMAIVAMISYTLIVGNKIIFSKVVKLILLVLFLGFAQSWFSIPGYHYEILRSLRWAISMPLYFVIAATMVNNKEKTRLLLLALFFGSIVSAFEHILFVRNVINELSSDVGIEQIRTIAFRSPGLWLLLSSIVWMPKMKGLSRKILIIGGSLFALSVLLNQTRSIWISSITAIPIAFILFPQKKTISRIVTFSLLLPVLFACMLAIMHYAAPSVNVENIVEQRLTTFSDEDIRFDTTKTRQNAIEKEIEAWTEGTFVFGRGLVYFAPYYLDYYKGTRVAWGHVGHLSTLAQLGIIGFLVFAIYLPHKVIQASGVLWRGSSQELKFFGLLGGMCMVSSWVCFFMSDSFLGHHAVEGVIFGGVWAQARLSIVQEKGEKKD